jgi:hypothetical protein
MTDRGIQDLSKLMHCFETDSSLFPNYFHKPHKAPWIVLFKPVYANNGIMKSSMKSARVCDQSKVFKKDLDLLKSFGQKLNCKKVFKVFPFSHFCKKAIMKKLTDC